MGPTLVILTTDFPDPILDKEIPFLSACFEKIYVLPTNKCGQQSQFKNVEAIKLFPTVDHSKTLQLVFKHLVFIFRIYGWTILRRGNFFTYLKYYRSFIGYIVIEAERIKPLERFIEQKRIEHAIFYDYWLVDSTLVLADLKRRGVIKKAIARAHGFDLYHERQFETKVPFIEYRINHLDSIFAISQHGFNYLQKTLPPSLSKKIKLSYLGISPHFKSEPKKQNAMRYLLVSCSTLIPLKRVELIIEVLKSITLGIDWIHFGDGPELDMLKKKATELPLHIKATFRGQTKNSDILKYYETNYVDLFISLSESEGLPVSMMEAISFGIPVFAYSIYGIPEIVNNQTGTLIDSGASTAEISKTLQNTLLTYKFNRSEIRNFFLHRFNAKKNYKLFIAQLVGPSNAKAVGETSYVQCQRCVLDNQDDPDIIFNVAGVCSYCTKYDAEKAEIKANSPLPEQYVNTIISAIKKSGEKRLYDCILGISGGVDSTYLAYIAHKFGLRVLAVHFDNGWNSELAVMNIENIVSKLGFDLHTVVVDWEEFRDLQVAFIKASVIDIEVVTDHAMLATLYKLAVDKNVKYILSGHNIATELILPERWYVNKRDHIHVRAINKLFGSIPLKSYPLLTTKLKFLVEWKDIKSVALLNYLPYNKNEVKTFISEHMNWRDYGGKHYESIFTRFYQGYILPKKFGVDKRKAHLSNLICSQQITRDEAIAELKNPPYPPHVFATDYPFVLKKLKLTEDEFERLMQRPIKQHNQYPVETSIYERFTLLKLIRPFWKIYKRMRERLAS